MFSYELKLGKQSECKKQKRMILTKRCKVANMIDPTESPFLSSNFYRYTV